METFAVDRKEDMSPDGVLRLFLQSDGDVIVQVVQVLDDFGNRAERSKVASVEFCASGGRSKRTLRALRALAQAMALDNTDPDLDHGRNEYPGVELIPDDLLQEITVDKSTGEIKFGPFLPDLKREKGTNR